MGTHQSRQGIALLISSVTSVAICAIIFFVLLGGTVGSVMRKAQKDRMIRFLAPTPNPNSP